jgi:tetratricopeptide (TPR) repeat protein
MAGLVGLLVGRFALAGGGLPEQPAPAARGSSDGRRTEAEVARLQVQLRAAPGDPDLLARLGTAYLARARETADPSWYPKAATALEQSRAGAGDQPLALTATGLLHLARHEFDVALVWGERALAVAPDSDGALGVVVDAQVELGRYDDAARTVQAMVDRRPSLASLARVSYLRELRGDAVGAITAMNQAVTAGSGSADDLAHVQTLLGDLYLGQGDVERAEGAYKQALVSRDGYGAAEVGLARTSAARGDLEGGANRIEAVVSRLPDPAGVALLGDMAAALGDPRRAAGQYELVRRIEELNRANGVTVDLELARFEADHARDPGVDPNRAVDMARAALAQRPTIYGADVLSWALRQAGRPAEALPHARSAVRLGTRDALLWYHLATVEADLGLTLPAAQDLRQALSINPQLTVRDLPAARSLASRLAVQIP